MIKEIFKKIPFIAQLRQKNLLKDQQVFRNNAIKVLFGYRYLLKKIPQIYPRRLQQAQKLAEIKWLFKEGKTLPHKYQAQNRIQHMQKLIKQLKQNDYSSLVEYVPNYRNNPKALDDYLYGHTFLKKRKKQ